MAKEKLPMFDALMNPLVQALKSLGGSGTIEEIYNRVAEITNLSDEQLGILHKGRTNDTEIAYRLAWSRTYLRKYGLLENSSRGVWALGFLLKDYPPSLACRSRRFSGARQPGSIIDRADCRGQPDNQPKPPRS